MENCTWAIETSCTWSGGNSSTKDTWTEIWGDGADAAVKDGATIIFSIYNICASYNYKILD